MAYETPKTDWDSSGAPTDADLNRIEGNTQALKEQSDNHEADEENPHNVTKAQVGLGSVQNYPVATQAQAEAGTANNAYMTPLRVAQAVTKLAPQPDLSNYARTDVRPTFKAGITDGDADNDVSHIRAYQHDVHGRTVVLVYTDGVLTGVTERTGGVAGPIVAQTTLTYQDGRLDQVQTVADGVTVTRQLNYDGSGRLTSVTPVA